MSKPIQTNDPIESAADERDNVHRKHAAGTGREDEAASGDPQPHVPPEEKGDPTHDTWQQIDEEKVQTAKEEMPAPDKANQG
jgi:hypothetical protein